MNSQQESQVHEQALREYKEFITKFDCKIVTKVDSRKTRLNFRMKGITSLDLSNV
jgi:hypothetical protein